MNVRRVYLLVVAAAGLIVIPIVSVQNFTLPYFWIGCGYLVVALGLLFFVTSSRSKVVLVNLVAIVATLTGFEWYFYSNLHYKEGRIENVYDGIYVIDHPDIGYTLAANLSRPNATKYLDDKLIYKASYSTNEYGLRRAMGGDTLGERFGCILIYGGSFTYGEGVNDDETLAWRIDVATGHRHRVFNFGLHGYGPHQMLASLESGHTSSIVGCEGEPVVVIYQAISDHVRRALGLTSWDKNGPRYLVDDQGQAVQAGFFNETLTRGRLFFLLDASYLFRAVLGSNRASRSGDADLFRAIVEKAKAISNELFYLQDFAVMYWDKGPEDELPNVLGTHGLRVFRVTEILPGSRSMDSIYRLVGDRHPSPLANEKLADFVVSQGLVPRHTSALPEE